MKCICSQQDIMNKNNAKVTRLELLAELEPIAEEGTRVGAALTAPQVSITASACITPAITSINKQRQIHTHTQGGTSLR
jgi:hypothetical protein